MAVSQAMFPKMIASVIGHYPRPKTNGLNLTLVVLTGALLVALLLGASDLDRWVIRDGSVACSDDEEAQFIQRSSNSGSLQYRIGKAVEDKKCFVVLANERVRIIELSTDGTRAKVHTQKQVEPQWMLTSDLKRASPGWLTLPWWPRAESISALSEVSHANNSPPLKEDGTCLLWEDAVRGDHIDECRRRMKLILPSQDVPVYVDPTPRLAPDGKCLDWNHAFRYRYMDTCRAAQAKRSGN